MLMNQFQGEVAIMRIVEDTFKRFRRNKVIDVLADKYLREGVNESVKSDNLIDIDYSYAHGSGCYKHEVLQKDKEYFKNKYEKNGYKNVWVKKVKTDTKGLPMYEIYGDKEVNESIRMNESEEYFNPEFVVVAEYYKDTSDGEMENDEVINRVEYPVSLSDLPKKFGKSIEDGRITDDISPYLAKAGRDEDISNWEIGHCISGVVYNEMLNDYRRYETETRGTDKHPDYWHTYVYVLRPDAFDSGIKVLQRKLGKMLLPPVGYSSRNEALDEPKRTKISDYDCCGINIDLAELRNRTAENYNILYENDDKIDDGAAGYFSVSSLCGSFDDYMEVNSEFRKLVQTYTKYVGDFLSSDREAAAFIYAIDELYPEIWDAIDSYTVNESLNESYVREEYDFDISGLTGEELLTLDEILSDMMAWADADASEDIEELFSKNYNRYKETHKDYKDGNSNSYDDDKAWMYAERSVVNYEIASLQERDDTIKYYLQEKDLSDEQQAVLDKCLSVTQQKSEPRYSVCDKYDFGPWTKYEYNESLNEDCNSYQYKGKTIINAGDYWFVKGYEEKFPTSDEAEEFVDDMKKDEGLEDKFRGPKPLRSFDDVLKAEKNREKLYYYEDGVGNDDNPIPVVIAGRPNKFQIPLARLGVDEPYTFTIMDFRNLSRDKAGNLDKLANESMKINIRESLNKMDAESDNTYDLLNLYESKNLSRKQKKDIARMIYENYGLERIYNYLYEATEESEDELPVEDRVKELTNDFKNTNGSYVFEDGQDANKAVSILKSRGYEASQKRTQDNKYRVTADKKNK